LIDHEHHNELAMATTSPQGRWQTEEEKEEDTLWERGARKNALAVI
jgi:hypothetical protein